MPVKSSSLPESPSVPTVSIGIPVYNSGELIRDCLEDVLAQTFQDFQILIYDNASTDQTGEIAREFAKKDPRISYVRQVENKGAVQNFVDVLNAADAKYFMWHADDDRLSPNFLEAMVEILNANSNADLAVGAVHSFNHIKDELKEASFPTPWSKIQLATSIRQLLGSRASWFYGLWRSEYLRQRFNYLTAAYPRIIGFDHLLLFLPIIEGRVVGSNQGVFYQFRGAKVVEPSRSANTRLKSKKPELQEKVQAKLADRSKFRKACLADLGRSHLPAWQRAIAFPFVIAHADRCSHSTARKLVHINFCIAQMSLLNFFKKPMGR